MLFFFKSTLISLFIGFLICLYMKLCYLATFLRYNLLAIKFIYWKCVTVLFSKCISCATITIESFRTFCHNRKLQNFSFTLKSSRVPIHRLFSFPFPGINNCRSEACLMHLQLLDILCIGMGQKFHLGFSLRCYRKSSVNLLANPIY